MTGLYIKAECSPMTCHNQPERSTYFLQWPAQEARLLSLATSSRSQTTISKTQPKLINNSQPPNFLPPVPTSDQLEKAKMHPNQSHRMPCFFLACLQPRLANSFLLGTPSPFPFWDYKAFPLFCPHWSLCRTRVVVTDSLLGQALNNCCSF